MTYSRLLVTLRNVAILPQSIPMGLCANVQLRSLAYSSVHDSSRSSGELNKAKTVILLLHLGEPSNEHEAADFSYWSFRKFYRHLPQFVSKYLFNSWYRISGSEKLSHIFSHDKLRNKGHVLADSHAKLCSGVQASLEQVIPEFSPHKCVYAHAWRNSSVESALDEIQSLSPERLLVVSLYPHFWCHQTTNCFGALNQSLKKRGFDPRSQSFRNQIVSKPPAEFKVTPSMSCSMIDRWSGHPALIQSWVESINEEILRLPYDVQDNAAFLFVAPDFRHYNSGSYRKEVYSSCTRISEAFNHSHPFALAYYSAWNQWPAQISRPSIRQGLKSLVREGRRNIIVVPVTNPISCIDTLCTLPSMLTQFKLKRLGVHHLRQAACPGSRQAFVHAFAELCKNHVLHGANSSPQYTMRCPNCYSNECYSNRRIFVL